MNTIADQILQAITAPLNVVHHDIINDSHRHSGPAQDSHFNLLLVSDAFSGKTPVKRHQMVYGLLEDLMGNPIHALALHCYTPEQWQQKQSMPTSPNCLGGS